MSQLCCHKPVTSDDMITVMITSHKVKEKGIEDFRRDDII